MRFLLDAALRGTTLRAVTAEGALQPGAAVDPAAEHEDDSGPLYCYRHPKSETYIRCNRCDEPICTRCAVQTPFGFKCRQCGLVKSAFSFWRFAQSFAGR